jgi:ubiquinone/menaquinone biosynthesis C-methylase UbiE
LPDGCGLRCPVTGKVYPYRDGVLDLLGLAVEKTVAQGILDTPFTAWFYDRFRTWITRSLAVPDFASEVARIDQRLQVRAGDTILDLACGHGNFTIEWAKRVGPDGLVIGVDISAAMLRRAAYHVGRWGLTNVLLIRGDAHDLPLAGGCLQKVNCSGGFHQFPDLPLALREIDRVSAEGSVLTASTLAEGPDDERKRIKRWAERRFELHFVPLPGLGEELAALGYSGYEWSLPGGWFGYASAIKGAGDEGAREVPLVGESKTEASEPGEGAEGVR